MAVGRVVHHLACAHPSLTVYLPKDDGSAACGAKPVVLDGLPYPILVRKDGEEPFDELRIIRQAAVDIFGWDGVDGM